MTEKLELLELKRLTQEAIYSLEDAVKEGSDGGPCSNVNGAYQNLRAMRDKLNEVEEAYNE